MSQWTHERMMVGLTTSTWVTKDGRDIPLRDLTDEHLAGIRKFLESKLDNLQYWQDRLDQACWDEDEDPEFLRRMVDRFTDWSHWVPTIDEEIHRRAEGEP